MIVAQLQKFPFHATYRSTISSICDIHIERRNQANQRSTAGILRILVFRSVLFGQFLFVNLEQLLFPLLSLHLFVQFHKCVAKDAIELPSPEILVAEELSNEVAACIYGNIGTCVAIENSEQG